MNVQTEVTKHSVSFKFPEWSGDPYILLPACAYHGNQFACAKRKYAPMYYREEWGTEREILITDVPRLNPDGTGKIEITTGDLTTPCVGIYFPDQKKAWLVFTIQGINGKNFGITVSKGEVLINGIAMRSSTYRWSHWEKTDPDVCEETIEIPYQIIEKDADTLQGLFDAFFENRKCMGMDDARPDNMTPAEIFAIQQEKFNRENWSGRYYKVGTVDEACQDWQCGWTGGAISSYPLLKLGNETSKQRALQTLDFLFSTQAASGFFPGIVYKGKNIGDGFGYEGTDKFLLIRKNADVLYFLFKHFELMGSVPQAYQDGARKLADAFVKLFDTYGQFGQFIDYETGEMIVGNTTSGGVAMAGLVGAYRFFGEEKYLSCAKAAGEMYVNRDVKAGVMTGGPGEILACPDSESSFGLLESLVALYDATKEETWLKAAKDCAAQCSTWVVSYNYQFPEDCEFGKLGVKTVGSVWANAQNKHSAPGICTLSGRSLYQLYEWTKDENYLELIHDIAAFLPQVMSREDRPVHAHDGSVLPPGYMCERVNMSDWEGFDWIGSVFNGSCWCETSLLLTLAELDFLI